MAINSVKNVVFEVRADTSKAQAELQKLIAQLDEVKKSSKLNINAGVTNLDAEIQKLTTKLDELAKKNIDRSNKETAAITANKKKQTQSDIDIINAEEKAREKKQQQIESFYAQQTKIQTQNQQSLTNAFQARVDAEVKANQEAESQKAKDFKAAFGEREKQEKAAQKETQKTTEAEIKDFEKSQKEKLDTEKKAQQELDKEKNEFVKKETKRFNQELKAEQDLAKELKTFRDQEQKDIDKLRSAQTKQNERDAKTAEKAQKAQAFKESPFGQLSQQAQAASEKARQLGAQLILLEQAGKKNTAEYNALAKEFKKVSQEALKTSEALNKLKFSSSVPGARQSLTGLAGAVNFISQSVANSSTNFVRLRNIIARTGVALGAVSIGASLLSFGRAAVKAATDYEVLSVSFGTLIGNATLAQQKIKELRTFAAETPFTVDDVFQASRTLLGYGITVGDLIPTIKTLGDVAGGVGVPLERLALVFGQVKAAGRLYGQDLLQLVTAGFNPLSEISRTTGESFDSLKDKMRKGLITFDDVKNAFITATSEGGKFFGLTNALANTTQGQLARLNEEYTELLRQVGEGLLPAYNGLINFGKSLLEFLRELPNTIKENSTLFTLLTTATTALTAAYFANSLNVVKNTGVTVFNTGAKVANRIATAAQAGWAIIATRQLNAQTIATAAYTTGTRLATSATNAFKAAWAANPLGLIITLLSTAAAAWYAFGDAVDTANDGFIDADEAFAEFEVTAKKATDEQIAAVEKTFAVIKDTTKSLKERQKAADEVNKEYETGLKLVGDEKKDVNAINTAWGDVKDAIKAANDEIVSGEIIKKLKAQIADVQIELLNLSSKAGVEIPLTLLTSDKEIQSGYEETQNIINAQADTLGDKLPNAISRAFTSWLAFTNPGSGIETVKNRNEQLLGQSNAVEQLNVQLDKLKESQKTLGAFFKLLQGDGGLGGGTPTVDPAEKEKERLRRLKEYQDQLASLLDRIRKNNEDIRKQAIEFRFVDAANFEEEVAKLELLDKINEERINREIDKEQEAVRRRDLTEQQKSVLIAQLEIIRGQEQQQRVFDLQERIYEIERDGTLARRKLALELNDLYNDIVSERVKKEIDALDELRDGLDDFYNDIFEDNPFAKGRFIKAPLFGDFGFQFEDFGASIQQLEKDLKELNALSLSSEQLGTDSLQEQKIKLIDEFNEKYKTTITLQETEIDQANQLSKAYEDVRKAVEKANNERKKVGIFKFAKQIIEQGAIDPFVLAQEDSRREYFTKLDEGFNAEKKRLTDARNAAATEYRTLYEGNVIEKADADLQIAALDIKLQEDIRKAEEETDEAKKQRLKDDIKANEDRQEKLRAIIKEERDARLQAIEDIKDALLDLQKVFIEGQIKQTEAAISAQERRVQAAQEIADKGNVVLLKAEQERLDKLNRQRANFVRQQQNLAAVEIAVNSAIAIAKAAGQPGAPLTIFAILAAMGVGFAQARAQAQAAATFAKGGYTGDGGKFQEAGTVHKGEFVINAEKTRQYRPLLEAIHAGRNPKALQSVQDRMIMVNSRSTDERLERIEKAIIGQKGMQLSIDENGINGIVSRVSYKQQRINNRAR